MEKVDLAHIEHLTFIVIVIYKPLVLQHDYFDVFIEASMYI
jgi:hypothetical protein